jgi:hypothetical protein
MMSNRALTVSSSGAVAAALLLLVMTAAARAKDPAPPAILHVPRISSRIRINAETAGKALWDADVGITRNFKDAAGRGMVPFTQAKARWTSGTLYLLLYAGDLDLEGREKKRDGAVERDDAFHMEFGRGDDVRTISISVLGTVADALCVSSPTGRKCDPSWQSGVQLAVDRDGSLNKIGDNDEEWVVELSIPLSKLGLEKAGSGTHIPFSIRRCEIGHDGPHACGSWGVDPPGELVLDP